jgi:hypothetical protein
MPLAPEFKVVDAASVPATRTAAFARPAVVEKLTPDDPMPNQVDVETLLAAATAPSDAVAASVLPASVAADDGQGWMATLLGMLLMALGLVSVLGSSPTLREAVLLRD